MKRASHLFEKIISDENLYLAIKEVNKTHHWHPHHKINRCTLWVDRNIDRCVEDLRQIIVEGFIPNPTKDRDKYDDNAHKWRHISEPKQWPDQYVHHALIQVLQPIFMNHMDTWCCGSIRGRGMHYGKMAIEKWMRHDFKGTKYVLTCDIKHFYDNLTHDVVMNRMRQLIKDYKTLDLIERVISNGIKVGLYPSQWLANTVLQPLDELIRQHEGCKHYLRYMDNITIFSSNKRKLRRLKNEIEEWLTNHDLELKDDWQIYATKDRLPDAVGYRYGRTYTIPRKYTFLKIKRSIKKYRKKIKDNKNITPHFALSIISRLGMLKHCNNCNLYKIIYYKGEKLSQHLKNIIRCYQPISYLCYTT